MKSLHVVFFGLIAVFSFVNVCGGETSTIDTEDENEEVESIAAEIESELEEAIADMIVENEEKTADAGASMLNPPLMFPSLTKTSKSQRTQNKDMAVKVASIVEQAIMMVANDILQTTVLLQTDPDDFLQAETNTTSS